MVKHFLNSSKSNNYMKATLLFLQGIGVQEILLIGLFVLIFFGAKKIPDFMKGLGRGVREFKDAVKDVKKDVEETGRIEDGK
jgi:sec-independent protein translocase protein TatA